MFGGICWLLNGNLCFGIHKDFLILRVGEAQATEILKHPHTKPMDLTGKIMKGWVMVYPEGYEDAAKLSMYIDTTLKFVKELPSRTK